MSAGVWMALLLALAAAAYVVAPLLRRDAAEAERLAAAASEAQELHSRREMALAALKDLEDDRATGKIGGVDYRELERKLKRQAVDILKRLDELEARERGAPPVPGRTS